LRCNLSAPSTDGNSMEVLMEDALVEPFDEASDASINGGA